MSGLSRSATSASLVPWRPLIHFSPKSCYASALNTSQHINLDATLNGGQCFRWKRTPRDTWIGVVGDHVYEVKWGVETSLPDLLPAKAGKRGGPRGLSAKPVNAQDLQIVAQPLNTLYGRVVASLADLGQAEKGRKTSTTSSVKLQPFAKDPLPSVGDSTMMMMTSGEREALQSLFFYLALDTDMEQLWKRWTDNNPQKETLFVRHLIDSAIARQQSIIGDAQFFSPYVVLTHLRQDVHETLFSFLCSQNNHVKRISGMIERLATSFGDLICLYNMASGEVKPCGKATTTTKKRVGKEEGKPATNTTTTTTTRKGERVDSLTADDESAWVPLHRFPTIAQLRNLSEDDLRQLGFGYRSRYIVDAAQYIINAQPIHASTLSTSAKQREAMAALHVHSSDAKLLPFYRQLTKGNLSVSDMRSALLAVPGVGRKVADCVLLFSLDCCDLVPVDTHMAQLSAEFLCDSKQKIPSSSSGRKMKNISETENDVNNWKLILAEWRWKEKKIVVQPKASAKGAKKEDAKNSKKELGAKKQRTEKNETILKGNNQEKDRGEETQEAKLPALLPKHHDAIQRAFVDLFGDRCGLAHSVLFYERLRGGSPTVRDV